MWEFSLLKALGLMVHTAPFLLLRVITYFGIALGLILATGTGAGLGYGIGLFVDEEVRHSSPFWGGAIGFGLASGVVFFLRDYLLYMVKAGHIAVLVELLDGHAVPRGRGQIIHARKMVRQRFGQASALFALDRLIKGVVTLVTGVLEGVMAILPGPGLDRLMVAARAYLRLAVGLVDEVILGHAIRSRPENAWEAAHDGLVLYAQNGRAMLGAAAWLTLVVWVLSALVFLVMLAPAAGMAWLLPGEGSGAMFVFAVVLAWAAKVALIEPFAIACLLQVFFKVIEGEEPNAEWRGRLTQASDKFRRLGEQATVWRPASRPEGDDGL